MQNVASKGIFCGYSAGPDDMPAHIKSSMFGCALTYVFQFASMCTSFFSK